ncbi:SigE family RNA polymerase sigma factor [Micromonospora sp. WMMA1949]|uniref:SigE family RNA polymerase sigma factor n=1 Tax=Micromonospora sp. WMMA1949 TaxID=3015162 RepID=UPI0022B658E0|nr:SigE family RNA polymerase sigma factor [Micromonospora sp. WMMA1949]MCZ7426795.1 SigE family RNA polymerase sigma factor [Micromonospora sp. WMMA1949]
MRAEDETEYVAYVRARLPVLHRTAYLICGDAHLADDIVQTTLTKLYRYWRRAAAADDTDAYVRRVLIHTYLDERRRGWFRIRLLPQAPDRPAAAPPDVEERDGVEDLLAGLPPAQRAVLTLRFLCDLPVAEVASLLNCSTGNVKSHTSRGLAKLRKRLDLETCTDNRAGG